MRYFYAGEDIEFVLTEDKEITFEKHNHVSMYVAGIILAGTIEIYDGDNTTVANQDDLFIIPIYQVHALRLKNTDSKILTMCIRTEFLQKHSLEEGKQIFTDLLPVLRENKLIDSKQESAFLDAYDVIYQMFVEQIAVPDQMSDLAEKMVSSPESDWKLDELANSIYINKYYFIRKFKNTIGLTPHYFQIQNRVRKAQHLLQEGHSITETAMEMGFYDQSHFDKAFHNIVGISPKEYLDALK